MKIKIENTTYEIPTSYAQVKYIDFARARTAGLPLEQKLSLQTTIPAELFSKLPWSAIKKLIELVSFHDEMPQFYEQYSADINVGNEHYIKMEQSRLALTESENQWVAAIEIVKTYTGIDITDMPVVKAFGYAVFFLNSLNVSSPATNASANTNTTKTSSTPA